MVLSDVEGQNEENGCEQIIADMPNGSEEVVADNSTGRLDVMRLRPIGRLNYEEDLVDDENGPSFIGPLEENINIQSTCGHLLS